MRRGCLLLVFLVLPATAQDRAVATAERILEKCREHKFAGFPKPHPITLSMGVATYPADSKTIEGLIEKADEALYWVKSHGRNGVAAFQGIIELECVGHGGVEEIEPKDR